MTLMVTNLIGFGARANISNPKFIDVLTDNTLTTNLKLCVDAGDENSFTSGQSWLDRSGGGYDFTLGATSGSSTDDPTFNGVAGGLSDAEYFTTDGGDFFEYDSAQETWMDALHKDNAIYSWAGWVYWIDNSSVQSLWGDFDINQTTVGASCAFVNASDVQQVLLAHGGGSTWAFYKVGVTTLNASAWNFCAGTINEAGGGSASFFYTNGTDDAAFDAAYTSPSSSGAQGILRIWNTEGVYFPPNLSRIAGLMMWQGTALTAANFDTIYDATKGRFGL
jgi:hypothetical protein